jgi:hypothetical protein
MFKDSLALLKKLVEPAVITRERRMALEEKRRVLEEQIKYVEVLYRS